ncbi:serine/threonine-protein kinase [Microlunatus parietis]|uniref:non-specific serine/threonine protein kinase n=1 Tax=Microlunatus parietis TaxID=682979 RepID=A0A7Y9I3J5_9ACTN|nr:serine/threonine-protein kinase [Microlunatus parietis]NYE69564.1 serine/threonine-protein kinase [Microlunatus parietis]
MGEVFAGRYELVDLLDEGGMGTVWRAWDLRESAYRAAKVLKQSDSASLLRFVRETSWRIDHEHVITPLGWVGEDDRVLFTMPLVRGGTAALLIKDYGRLPPLWAITLLDQLLQALAAVHAVGLVHRDVKPSNLLLEATGRDRPVLRLTDFGIAAAVDDPRLTRVGEVIGTPGYLSPEAAYGADPDPRQDLYAAGLVTLELLTGVKPGPRPEIPAELQASPLGPLLGRLLAPHPAERIGSAEQARAELATIRWWGDPGAEIEVFDHLPPLPAGWLPDGPATRPRPQPAAVSAVSAASAPGPVSPPQQAPEQPSTKPDPVLPYAPASGQVAAGPRPALAPERRRRLTGIAIAAVGLGAVCLIVALVLLLT